jgi:hypothetical protein
MTDSDVAGARGATDFAIGVALAESVVAISRPRPAEVFKIVPVMEVSLS